MNKGDKINDWEIIGDPYIDRTSRPSKTLALCRCKCGNERIQKLTVIKTGRSKSCGECKTYNKEPIETYLKPTGNYRTERTKTDNSILMWEFECICGNIVWKPKNRFLTGETKSCGCQRTKIISRKAYKQDAKVRHPIYHIWCVINARSHKTNKRYDGSEVCEEWKIAENFIKWAESGYQRGSSLRKTDKNKPYSPDNCFWGPQIRNKEWTEEQVQFLIDNHQEMTCEEIAPKIGKTRRAVQHKFGNLGLQRYSKFPTIVKYGDTFERLTIIGEPYSVPCGGSGKIKWKVKCVCRCGKYLDTLLNDILKGSTKSCGCYNRETSAERAILRNTKYSDKKLIKHPLYRVWDRVKNDSEKWDNYEIFYNDNLDRFDEEKTIYKIDPNLPFSKENSEWRTVCKGKSISEIELRDWLNSNGFNFQSTREIIKPKELDMYEDRLKIAVEYCGLNYHHEMSLSCRGKNYHIDKYKQCKDKNIRLITIFSDEWSKRTKQVKNFLKSVLGIHDRKVFARKCRIEEISHSIGEDFCEQNHIQGCNRNSILYFGVFENEELLGVTSFGLHHRNNTELVLNRMCFLSSVQVVGGASKLLKYSISKLKEFGYNKVISWSDNRWSVGNVYEKMGFILDEELNADYSYVNISQPYSRRSKQSMRKSNTGCPEDKTEREWALENGYARIWDCGKRRYIYNIP